MTSASYNLYSTEQGSPGVGVWRNTTQSDQFVTVSADSITWIATPQITVRGPYKLAVEPYKYTYEREGEVLASNDPSKSQDWYILPIEGTPNYYISLDTVGNSVWTAGQKQDPITIQPFTGEPNQVFKFVKQ